MKLLLPLLVLILLGSSCTRLERPLASDPKDQAEYEHKHDTSDGQEEPKQEHSQEGVIVLTPEQREEIGIKIAAVKIATDVHLGTRTGRVEADPDRKVVVSPQVSGTVEAIAVIVGSKVQRGDLIAKLDSPDITQLMGEFHQAEVECDLARKELENKIAIIKLGDESRRELEEAKLEVARAKAAGEGVQARLDSAKLSYDRLAKLREEGIASSQQVEEANATLKALEADLRQAKSELDIAHQHLKREQSVSTSRLRQKAETFPAEASLERAKESLKHIRERLVQLGANPEEESGTASLYSPISGIVVERPISRGQVVTSETTIAVLVDPTEVWVWVDLQRSDLQLVKTGDLVKLQLVSDARVSASGTIISIDPQVEVDSQTVRARVRLNEAGDKFKVGSFINATLLTTSPAPAVPQEAIVEVEGEKVVYVASGDRFIRTPVRLIASGPETATISGLAKGTKIVVRGANDLKAVDLASEIGGHHH